MPIAFLSLLLASSTVPATSVDSDEIVVMAHKLDRWTGRFEIREARRKCWVKTSSGDAEIDQIGCQAFLTCADQYQPETDASDEKGIDRPTRQARKDMLIAHMRDCIADRRAALLAQLAERRKGPLSR